jgi:uncharacterized protein YkwD/LysM repeat protein
MPKRTKICALTFLVLTVLILYFPVYAQTNQSPRFEASPFDLVNAVNALRAAYGLPAYSINSILMFTAQNQSDFMASTGNVAHIGAGGSNFTERLLAAGYPLGGDLSQGGFRSENIIAGNNSMSAQSAVEAWMGDMPHQNTMLSQYLTEIGAGVSVVDGKVYYVIDCARPSTGGALSASTSVFESGTIIPANESATYPVVLSTPNSAGDVIHEVQAGQTLWQIAISYSVKIDDIKRLNNLFDNNIYPGNKLLIKKAATLTSAPPLETATPEATSTIIPSATSVPTLFVVAIQTTVMPIKQNDNTVVLSAIAIIALAILLAGIFTFLGKSSDNGG